ncbi:DUF296 domain-containing protein [Thermosyntropha sp.]|uniref:PPC domain-containing DNA-binding protein n=1 Tax=Thermosyntropha sp. TaxID=2740820 RepID=UPI0025E549C3|nr:DUF296 domain-containing protein [Thermosyntropha sp.]MBO8158486.1 DUF296 domain-containing protein [Thermosyntropha sp.]
MKYQEGKIGRIFVIKFEHGDDVLQEIVKLAESKNISAALVFMLGALKSGQLVVGPNECVIPPEGISFKFEDGREILALGTLFKDENRKPSLHIHTAAGREEKVRVGCLRADAEVYLTVEAVILELDGLKAARLFDPDMQLKLLTFLI